MKSPMVVLRPLFRTMLAAFAALTCTLVTAASVWPVGGEQGMVVTAQQLATKVGVDVLKQGGNAVDAAVAVGYALAVVYPAAGNLGGGGFMTLQLADGRKTFIDFREKAPLAATADMYLDAHGNVIKNSSTTGTSRSACRAPSRDSNTRARSTARCRGRTLIAPAIALAERGFMLDAGRRRRCSRPPPKTSRADRGDAPPSSSNNGQPYKAGDRLVQKDLARTLRLIAQRGPRRLLQRASSPTRSPRRARSATASSPRRTSRSIACASWRRSNATTAAITSSRRRRLAPAASSCARS